MDATTTSTDIRAGINLYLQQDYPGAERELKNATGIQPTWAEGWSYLGFAYYMQQKFTEAATALEKAVLLDGDNAESRFGLGLVWAAMQRVDAAIACWDETVRLKPAHAGAKQSLVGGLMHRAQQSLDAKDYDKAEYDLERAIKIDRTAAAPVCMLVNHFLSLDAKARAQKTIREALAYLPNDPHIQTFAAKLDVKATDDVIAQQQDNQARAQVQKSQEIPCPACKRMVMEWTVICPHCTSQIKAMPSHFAALKAATPVATWQQVMYYIVTVLWVLLGAGPFLLLAATMGVSGAFSGLAGIPTFFGIARLLLGVGLLFQNDFCMHYAKWLSTIGILKNLLWIMVDYYARSFIGVAMDVFAIGLDGMLIYLLNYMGAD